MVNGISCSLIWPPPLASISEKVVPLCFIFEFNFFTNADVVTIKDDIQIKFVKLMEVTLRSKIDLRFCTGMDGTNSLICGQEIFWLPITILAQPKRTLNFGYFRIQWTSHDDLIGWLRFNFLIVIFRINVDPYKNLSNHIKHLTNDFCSFFRLDRESWKYSAIIGWRLCSGWARPLPRVVPVPRKRKSGRQKFPKKTALWRFSKCCYG